MKKVLSIMLAAVMLCGLFAMPVSAKEYSSSGMQTYVLGENTALSEDGYVVFDEVGDSFTTYVEVDEDANYLGAINIVGVAAQHYIGTAIEVDGVRIANNGLASSYYPKTVGASTRVGLCYVALTAGRHEVKVINLEGAYNVGGVFLTSGNYTPAAPTSLVRWGASAPVSEGNYKIQAFQKATGSVEVEMGVPEDGIYKLAFEVRASGASGGGNLDVNISVDGGTKTKVKCLSWTNGNTSTFTYVDLMDLTLSKGSHKILIEAADWLNYVFYARAVKLTKTGEVTYPTITADYNYNTSNKNEGVGKGTGVPTYPHFGGAGAWIEETINVAYDGIYTPVLTWWSGNATAGNVSPYPYLYIDDVLVWSDMITDTTETKGPNSGGADAMLTTFNDCYLSAGTHKIKMMSAAGYFYIDKIVFTKNAEADGTVIADVVGFDAEKSAGVTTKTGNGGYVVTFDADAYANVEVITPEAGFYTVGVVTDKGNGNSKVTVSANGTQAGGTIIGIAGAGFRTEATTGMIYLKKGVNNLTVRAMDVGLQIDSLVLTPAAWADRVISPKSGELYAGEVTDANLAKSVAANTEYTAVADIGGAYLNKSVALIVAVYEGGVLKAAYYEGGIATIGSTITKTFTTPEAAGNYSVKVFVLDAAGDYAPFTEQTEILPAVAE